MPPKHQQVPAKVGPWLLDDLVGRGAFGAVYTAHRLGEAKGAWVVKVAVYVPPKGKKHDAASEGGRLLYWEHTIMCNFVRHHEQFAASPAETKDVYGEDQGMRYLAMERFPLGDLAHFDFSHTPAFACTVGLKLLSALKQLHGKGILYRDVKPDNIMMHETRWAVLVDLGACIKFVQYTGKPLDPGQGEAGTPRFMSRHVHRGDAPAARDDVESLAYLLLWMVLGALPWDDAPDLAVVRASKEACSPQTLCVGEARALLPFIKTAMELGSAALDYAGLASVLIRCGGNPSPEPLSRALARVSMSHSSQTASSAGAGASASASFGATRGKKRAGTVKASSSPPLRCEEKPVRPSKQAALASAAAADAKPAPTPPSFSSSSSPRRRSLAKPESLSSSKSSQTPVEEPEPRRSSRLALALLMAASGAALVASGAALRG